MAWEIYPLILALYSSACVSTARPPMVPYELRDDAVERRPISPSDTPFREVAAALEIPDLRDVVLPQGYREIRVSASFGMVAGSEIPMLRLVEGPSGVSGDLITFWADAADATGTRARGARCVAFRRGLQICARTDSSPRNWTRVAADLMRMDAWTIQGPCREEIGSVSHAGTLLIQRLESASFDTYSCSGPWHNAESTVGRRAKALFDYLYQMTRS